MTLTPPDVLSLLPPPFEWCEVKYSTQPVQVQFGEWENFQYVIKEIKPFEVNRTFWIAKYPITNQQYNVFLNDPDGYANVQWWDSLTSDGAQENRLANPEPLDIPRENDRPAVHLNFYNAQAFCRWLASRLVIGNMTIGLPREFQWQKAAQGDDERLYPWGNEFDSNCANTRESNIVKTTPVTQYPEGMSPYGVMDMSGNVWEWCYRSAMPTETTSGTDFHVLRGGSWRFDSRFATTTYRYFYEQEQGHGNIGFRIMTQLMME